MSISNDEDDTERQAFLPRDTRIEEKTPPETDSANWTHYKHHLRLFLEIFMAVVILILSIRSIYDKDKDMNGRSPVPIFPLKTYTFNENSKYMNESIFSSSDATLKTLHNWIELSAVGRGYVQIEQDDAIGLSEPYSIEAHWTTEPVYMMSVFHQLHCLSYLVQAYQSAFAGTALTQELAHHSSHCFDYLRQSIMCAADTTLEGKTESGPGWGSTHQCKDYDALLKWANEHSVTAWRANMIDTAIL
ncbi:hypothetical protein TMatcc_009947 [Talaromyces marneffei ATCC 18224]|uniref:Oxidase ustYa n=1 Tax=Talaromyces marneffei (strain ATCC 18224 / CBS 334.59 / QM 7333) TaxID=441960 RepID=B6QTR2_TALMQ|nr:uncharacterized protein EYB26_009165 [Talaromyces marneffei]EEA19804.1 conserved hypothetical protein [Talaromyces marneffei ATCC 18224]KAE8548107.1 hypothetical protein EYB25_009901 [Talaromyces marneffei]QGA21454.1 hypothetical protein EYB26_009165 [Talaromyces marneffei]